MTIVSSKSVYTKLIFQWKKDLTKYILLRSFEKCMCVYTYPNMLTVGDILIFKYNTLIFVLCYAKTSTILQSYYLPIFPT